MSGDQVKRRRPKRPSNYDLVPRDFTAIHLADAAEVAYWCANFRCTGSELRAAVSSVGTSVRAVTQHLQSLAGRSNVVKDQQALNSNSSTREVVISTVKALLRQRDEHRLEGLVEQVMRDADVLPHADARWVFLSTNQRATIVHIAANVVRDAALDSGKDMSEQC
jgi:uncharacterized protein DUF3606